MDISSRLSLPHNFPVLLWFWYMDMFFSFVCLFFWYEYKLLILKTIFISLFGAVRRNGKLWGLKHELELTVLVWLEVLYIKDSKQILATLACVKLHLMWSITVTVYWVVFAPYFQPYVLHQIKMNISVEVIMNSLEWSSGIFEETRSFDGICRNCRHMSFQPYYLFAYFSIVNIDIRDDILYYCLGSINFLLFSAVSGSSSCPLMIGKVELSLKYVD